MLAAIMEVFKHAKKNEHAFLPLSPREKQKKQKKKRPLGPPNSSWNLVGPNGLNFVFEVQLLLRNPTTTTMTTTTKTTTTTATTKRRTGALGKSKFSYIKMYLFLNFE